MIKELLHKNIVEALDNLKLNHEKEFTVEIPNNPEFGDYSTNAALVLGKENKMKPKDLAEKIVKELKKNKAYKKLEIAGPGFINFFLSPSLYQQVFWEIYKSEDYGKSDFGNQEKILLEFVSANPTGPLNIVSARAAAFGDTLYRIMKYVGYAPAREFYINDAGNQVDILAESLELRLREIHGEKIGEFPYEAYHGEYVKHLAHRLNALEGTRVFMLPQKDRLEHLKEFALSELLEMQRNSLEKFGVFFEGWVSEKALRAEGVVEEVLSYLTEADCTYEKEDAIWFNSTKYGDDKDRVLMKSDGSITYFVPDVAYHLTKIQRGFTKLIDIFGPDHHGYVPRIRAAFRALNYDDSILEFIFLQQVNIFESGERVKMSKRAGKIVTMDDLISVVGKDAARYFFIARKANAHLNFDLELALKKNNENPVYYCQYAHARICSIIKKARSEKIYPKHFKKEMIKKLNKPEELALIQKMADLPELLILIAVHREPHRLTTYIEELASLLHHYYEKYQIVNVKNPALSQARLMLLYTVRKVMQICFELMGISAPETM
ncbi:MAG TPA: arginine--tRNA ligase [Candidatus Cloacimonas acidaminovorans]|jgi:arginyl-tRNA synthetase|nr:arginine--tRNA ligase [Candidatus Cloacimonas acidaminovorans]HRS60077.1 arginine--tRNA ligase [Candidatus Cloacimonas sp.]MDD5407187.1 arginine--tRNA ligase [Candidatus Cloacimonas acidaminovorans]HOE54476.1 arginine--tRNA ligase [Candidatus Cloacimonas acidaminovorans]HOM78543.1 arginine--tRNA ligase [Candidatus Cloacimonas acidaminovorans]